MSLTYIKRHASWRDDRRSSRMCSAPLSPMVSSPVDNAVLHVLASDPLNDASDHPQSLFDSACRSTVCSGVPQDPCETPRDEQLPAEFGKDRGVSVLLKQGGRCLEPPLVGQPHQFQQHHFQIVAVTPHGAKPE